MGKAEPFFFLFPPFFVALQSPFSSHGLCGLSESLFPLRHRRFLSSSPAHRCVAAGGGCRRFVGIDPSLREILEALKTQKCKTQDCALRPPPPTPVLLATPPPDTLSFCTPSSSFSGAPLRVLTRFGGSAARGVFKGILHRRNMCSGHIEA